MFSLRRLRLEDLFSRDPVDFVGIQESKCSGDIFRTGAEYTMIAAGALVTAGPVGSGIRRGCELWVHRRLKVPEELMIAFAARENCLVVRLPCLGQCLVFLVAHAPTSLQEQSAVVASWDELDCTAAGTRKIMTCRLR